MSNDRDPRIKFGDENPRIRFVDEPSLEQIKIAREYLLLPEDLSGKKVLELFSGDREASLYAFVTHAGGDYRSLDLRATDIPGHTVGRAENVDQFFPAESFDFIVMNGPVVWGRYLSGAEKLLLPTLEKNYAIIPEKVLAVFQAAMKLLRRQKGNHVSISGGLTTADSTKMHRLIKSKIVNADPNWFVTSPRINDYTTDISHHLVVPTTISIDHSHALHLFHR